MPKIVNYYSNDKTAIFKRLFYLQRNYEGIVIPNKNANIISIHDTNIGGARRVILEFENRKEIYTPTLRAYYEKNIKD